jgi:hypothetical protein
MCINDKYFCNTCADYFKDDLRLCANSDYCELIHDVGITISFYENCCYCSNYNCFL